MSDPPSRGSIEKPRDFAERLEELDEHLAGHVSGNAEAIAKETESAEVDSRLAGVRDILERINRIRKREADTDPQNPKENETSVAQFRTFHSANPETTSNPKIVGQQVGPYAIEEVIARGGMGVVFRAHDSNLGRTVALKMMLSGPFAFEEEKLRFQAEAEAAARLDHPGIVPIYGVGEHHGAPYFAMGLVEGGSLSERIRREPIDPFTAAELTVQIAHAVEYAHQNGIVHRDIKPANVLLDRNDRPRITDFGLARRSDHVSDLTGTHQVLGTPGYMAPEQATGTARSAGPLADVYSIGATLYCMITARPPFHASNASETLTRMLEKEPIAPNELNPSVPMDLNTICLKCLQKDATRRYQSADELADDLQRFLQRVPIIARPIGVFERIGKWSRRHPLVAWLSIAIAASLLALIIGGAWYQSRLNRTLEELAGSRTETVNHLYRSLTNEADFLTKVRPLGYGPRVTRLIAEANQLDSDQKDIRQLRQLAVSGLGFLGAREPIDFPDVDEMIRSANVDHESSQLIVGLQNGDVASFDLKSGMQNQRLKVADGPVVRIEAEYGKGRKTLRVTAELGRQVAGVSLDSQGQMELQSVIEPKVPDDFVGIEVTPDGRYLIGVQTKTEELSRIQHWVSPTSLAVADNVRDGRRSLSSDSQLFFSITAVADQAEPVRALSALATPRFDLNEHYLVAGHSWLDDPGTDDSVIVCNHHTGEVEREINTTCGALLNVRISPRGYFVAVGSQDGFELFQRNSGERIARDDSLGACTIQSFIGDDGDILVRTEREMLWFSPGHREPLARFEIAEQQEILQSPADGRFLVWTGTRTPRIVDLRGSDRVRMQAHSKTTKSVSFSRDGRLLISSTRYYGGNPSKVWDVQSGRLLFEFVGAESVFSPNGRWIASWSFGELKLWDVATGLQVASTRFDPFPASIHFSPQSDRIVIASRFPGQFGVWAIESPSASESKIDSVTPKAGLKKVLSDTKASAPVAFNPSGDRLAYACGSQIQVYDLIGNKLLVTIDPQGDVKVDSIGFRNDDELLVVTQMLQLWDLKTGTRRWISRNRYQPPLLFSRDRSHLMCRRQLLNASDFSEIFELPAWLGSVASAAWSDDGRRIAFGMDRGDVTVWDLANVQATLRSQHLSWDTLKFSDADRDPAISQMVTIGTRHAGEFAPRQWNQRYDNLITQANRHAERDWIIRETSWLAAHLDGIASRPFFEMTSTEAETCNRLRRVYNLARLLEKKKEYAAERDLLISARRAFEQIDSPSTETIRVASQIFHTLGDLHNFHLSEKQPCLPAYADEEQLLLQLREDSRAKSTLVSARFWLNRNWALAHHREGDQTEANRRMRIAIKVAEEFPDSTVDSRLVDEAKSFLNQWK